MWLDVVVFAASMKHNKKEEEEPQEEAAHSLPDCPVHQAAPDHHHAFYMSHVIGQSLKIYKSVKMSDFWDPRQV